MRTGWNTDKPAILAAPKPAAVADKAAGKAAASTKNAPAVGSMSAEAPGRKLGQAKPECVYKPVMTATDMENCK